MHNPDELPVPETSQQADISYKEPESEDDALEVWDEANRIDPTVEPGAPTSMRAPGTAWCLEHGISDLAICRYAKTFGAQSARQRICAQLTSLEKQALEGPFLIEAALRICTQAINDAYLPLKVRQEVAETAQELLRALDSSIPHN